MASGHAVLGHGGAAAASFGRKPGQGYSRRRQPAQPATTSACLRALRRGCRPACRGFRGSHKPWSSLGFSEAVPGLAVKEQAPRDGHRRRWLGCGRRALIGCRRGPRPAMLTTRKCFRVLEARGGGDPGAGPHVRRACYSSAGVPLAAASPDCCANRFRSCFSHCSPASSAD